MMGNRKNLIRNDLQTKIRRKIKLDFDWRFSKGDFEKAGQPSFDHSSWRLLDIPHDWSIEEPFDQNTPHGQSQGFLPRWCVAWYRKELDLPDYSGKCMYLQFDGIHSNSTVWVNGNQVGGRPYGYSSFFVDITDNAKVGKNIVAVRVDNSVQPADRWYSGAGIYRHVWLIVCGKDHIKNWGTYITTSEVSAASAVVNLEIEAINACGSDSKIVSVISDSTGRCVARQESEGLPTVRQAFQIAEPALWDIENPVLYYATSTLWVDGVAVDDYVTPFGIRKIEMMPGRGFILNGRYLKLKGVNLHHDGGCVGSAVPERVWERRLERLREMGCNAIRTSHNPPAPEFLDLCDNMGFLVFDEAFDSWYSGCYEKLFDEWWEKDLKTMIERDRNHPSIFIWSVGNEVQNQCEESVFEPLTKLTNCVRKTDPTRPVTFALFPAVESPQKADARQGFIDWAMRLYEKVDVLSCNYHEQWYEDYLKANPNMLIITSEAFPYYRAYGDYFFGFEEQNPWFDVMKMDNLMGAFIWVGIDYLGEARQWPVKGWSAGLLDTCGFRKSRSGFFEGVWTDKPMVQLSVLDPIMRSDLEPLLWSWPKSASHWSLPHCENELVTVATYTNCEEIEIYINEKLVGRKEKKPYEILFWNLQYSPGKIRAVGYVGNQAVCEHMLETAGIASRIMAYSDCTEMYADGQDVSHIEVVITDEKGIPVPDADDLLTFEVTGDARLIGVDNGDLSSNESYKGNSRRAYHGKCLAILQAGKKPGKALVNIQAQDLASATVLVVLVEPEIN